MPGRVGDVLDDRACQHDVELTKVGDLIELALAVGRDDADPLGSHQLDVAVERIAVARVPVARDDVVAEPAKGEGKGPEPGAHFEHLSALEAATPEQFHEPHHSDDVHAKVSAHRVVRQHGTCRPSASGSKRSSSATRSSAASSTTVSRAPLQSARADGSRNGAAWTIDVERKAGFAYGGSYVLGPRSPCAAGLRRDRVPQRERYLTIRQLDRWNAAGESGEDITLGSRRLGPVSNHQPSSRLAG